MTENVIEKYLNSKFGRLQPIEYIGLNKHKRKLFLCLCECGNTKIITDANLRNSTSSCGCFKVEKIKKELTKSPEHKKLVRRKWEDKNKRWLKESSKKFTRARCKKYRTKNKDKIKQLHKEKKKNDPVYLLKYNLKNRFKVAFSKKYKKGLAIEFLGCSIEEFKLFIEKQFYCNSITGEPMTWNNYGLQGWHLDHIIPLCSITSIESAKLVCNYKNIRPLWCHENLAKSRMDKKWKLT